MKFINWSLSALVPFLCIALSAVVYLLCFFLAVFTGNRHGGFVVVLAVLIPAVIGMCSSAVNMTPWRFPGSLLGALGFVLNAATVGIVLVLQFFN